MRRFNRSWKKKKEKQGKKRKGEKKFDAPQGG
jgi:hypothetical protein